MVGLTVSSAPELVSWDITARCNLHCAHCYGGLNRLQEDIAMAHCRSALDQMASAGVFQVVFLGGEPLIRPDFLDLVAHARSCGIEVGLSTNGTLVTPSNAQVLSKLGLHGVQVSIDSPYPALHDQFRGAAGCWEKATQGARELAHAGCRVVIAIVITRFNCNHLAEMAELAAALGAEELRTLRLIPIGRGANCLDVMVSPHQVLSIARELGRLRHEFAGQLDVRMDASLPFLENSPNNVEFCTAGTTTCSIKADGSMYPCSYFERETFSAGNIVGNAFIDLWQNAALRRFRKQPLICGPCSICHLVSKCKGGCRAAAYNIAYHHSAPDPYCYIPLQGGEHHD